MKGMDKASMVRRNKLINNLPKYDIGTTPISSGYQQPFNSYLVASTERPALDLSSMVSAQRSANTTQFLNSATSLAGLGKTLYDIGKERALRKPFEEATKAAARATTEAGKEAAMDGVVKHGISRGTGALLSAAATVPSALELSGAIGEKNSYNGPTGSDIRAMSSKYTNYVDGVSYDTLGTADNTNLMRTARLRDRGENTKLTTSAMGVGAGIGSIAGSIFPGLGNLAGSVIGAGLGGFLSLLGWNSNESDETARLLNNQSIVNNAYNDMSYADAATQSLRNEFHRTHGADQGLSPHRGKKNALVGGGEVITKHDAYGNVVDAMMEPITPYTPERADVIPIHLNENDGVLGNKINPLTGNRFAVDARYNINNPQALTQLVALQDMVTKKNRIKKYDQGKYLNMLGLLPGLMEMGVGAKLSHSYAKDPVHAINPYAINKNAETAANELASLHYNPYPILNSLKQGDRLAIYNMNMASLSPAQRMAMLSTYYNNKMRNKADILALGLQIENQYRAAHANLMAQLGEQDAQRKQSSNAIYADNLAKAEAARRKGIETGWQTSLKGLNTAVGNILNNYWQKMNIDLYRQYLKSKLFEDNTQTAANATIAGMPYVVPENQLRLASVIPGPLSAPQVIPDYLKDWEERDADEKKKQKPLDWRTFTWK